MGDLSASVRRLPGLGAQPPARPARVHHLPGGERRSVPRRPLQPEPSTYFSGLSFPCPRSATVMGAPTPRAAIEITKTVLPVRYRA